MAHQTDADGDSARGDQTRLRLLETAIEIFAHSAYDSVRTRMLADAAGVNQAAIPYYFGGKEGLYLAVAQRIAERLGESITTLTGPARKLLDDETPATDEALEDALRDILANFARAILSQAESSASTAIILREQQQPTKAFDLLYSQAMEPLHRVVSTLVARLEKLNDDAPEAILHAHMLLGQVLGFIAARTTLMRRLNQRQIEAGQIDYIAELLSVSRISMRPHQGEPK
jgi:TetR/AcrR family transcriptional regulator, regulator of cefoperazone and chloramphenicol sensitivity